MFTLKLRPMLVALALAAPMAAMAASYQDVLNTPARQSALAPKALLNGLARAGERVVAVGQRGHIVYSDDVGQTWQQAKVPVSSDLVAVNFPTATQGWAVGHDGVVLHSSDAGATWVKQLDGRLAGEAMLAYYTAQAEKGALGTPDEAAKLVDEARRIAAQGAENPFLDVWFADEKTGFVVGAFNLIFRTDDGGKTWEPWYHRTDNPNRLHLYGIRGFGAQTYVVGEQGLVLRLDGAGHRFAAVETPYKGTYFGLAGSKDAVVVFGLRGHAFRSQDGGKTWNKIETGVQDGLTAGTGGGDRLVLVSQAGNVLVSKDAGQSFAPVKMDKAAPASAVLSLGQNALVIAGPRGVRTQALQ
jgi:photosystem II stability/assembly factor-like uncharacterized protein